LNIYSIITARSSSTRLPNKILLNVGRGQKSIDILIKRAIKIGYPIILATSRSASDDKLCKYCEKNYKIKIFRGSKDNKIKRWYDCFQKFKIDKACMIDGDDLLFDFSLYKKMINKNIKDNYIFKYREGMIVGTFMYIFTKGFLKKLKRISIHNRDTEIIDPFLNQIKNKIIYPKFKKLYFTKNIRLTLDYHEDLLVFRNLLKKFKVTSKYSDIIKYMSKNKIVSKLNFFRQNDWKNNQLKKIKKNIKL